MRASLRCRVGRFLASSRVALTPAPESVNRTQFSALVNAPCVRVQKENRPRRESAGAVERTRSIAEPNLVDECVLTELATTRCQRRGRSPSCPL
jgi:hypothetical protein